MIVCRRVLIYLSLIAARVSGKMMGGESASLNAHVRLCFCCHCRDRCVLVAPRWHWFLRSQTSTFAHAHTHAHAKSGFNSPVAFFVYYSYCSTMEPSCRVPLCSRAVFHAETKTRLDLQRLLGRGQFAEVWSGVRCSDGKSCAIKCLSTSLFVAFKSKYQSSLDIEGNQSCWKVCIIQIFSFYQSGLKRAPPFIWS